MTVKEWIVLIILLGFLFSLIISILKRSTKIALASILVLILFTGFSYLPERVNDWLNSTPEYQPNIEEVMESMGTEAESWWQAMKKVIHKLAGN